MEVAHKDIDGLLDDAGVENGAWLGEAVTEVDVFCLIVLVCDEGLVEEEGAIARLWEESDHVGAVGESVDFVDEDILFCCFLVDLHFCWLFSDSVDQLEDYFSSFFLEI